MKRLAYISLILLLAACSGKQQKAAEPQPVTDLVAYFQNMDSSAVQLSPQAMAYTKVLGLDSLTPSQLYQWSRGPVMSMFGPEAQKVYPTLAPLEQSLGSILGNAADEGLELPRRSYAAVVWGRPESILFVDSVALIALNHYLGADFEGYSHWPDYVRAAKTPAHLPYDLAEALVATQYPYQAAPDNYLLYKVQYAGALVEAMMRLVPDASLSEIMGWTDEDMEYVQSHEDDIMRELIASGALFDSSPSMARSLLSPAPASSLAGKQYPPRLGCYMGYRIVQKYIKHNDTPLARLLSPELYNSRTMLE